MRWTGNKDWGQFIDIRNPTVYRIFLVFRAIKFKLSELLS